MPLTSEQRATLKDYTFVAFMLVSALVLIFVAIRFSLYMDYAEKRLSTMEEQHRTERMQHAQALKDHERLWQEHAHNRAVQDGQWETTLQDHQRIMQELRTQRSER